MIDLAVGGGGAGPLAEAIKENLAVISVTFARGIVDCSLDSVDTDLIDVLRLIDSRWGGG